MPETGDVERLLDKITEMPGNKILTLVTATGDTMKIDVDEQGKFGYEPAHKALFVTKLLTASCDGGGLMIRQFLSTKFEAEDGKKLPEKNLYTVKLGNGKWTPMSAEVVGEISELDHTTGERLEKEPGVHYKTFSI